jgi:hypothetical protein
MEPDYFLHVMYDRLSERLMHIYGGRPMVNSYAEVVVDAGTRKQRGIRQKAKTEEETKKDLDRIEAFLSFVDESEQPFFAHVHLLGTHGPYFYPKRQIFSRNKRQAEEWMTDFYDDAILNFDLLVRKVVRELAKRGLKKNTVIVVLTDHGQRWSIDNRIPLLFLFPRSENKGRIRGNAQILDIAPTLLDYIGIPRPEWMEGVSLLEGEPEAGRFIFTVDRKMGNTRIKNSNGNWLMDPRLTGPPFYSLGTLGAYYRQMMYKLDLKESRLDISELPGHTFPEDPDELPSPEVIEQLLIDHLVECGYDVSSIKRPFTINHIVRETVQQPPPGTGRKDRMDRKEQENRRNLKDRDIQKRIERNKKNRRLR